MPGVRGTQEARSAPGGAARHGEAGAAARTAGADEARQGRRRGQRGLRRPEGSRKGAEPPDRPERPQGSGRGGREPEATAGRSRRKTGEPEASTNLCVSSTSAREPRRSNAGRERTSQAPILGSSCSPDPRPLELGGVDGPRWYRPIGRGSARNGKLSGSSTGRRVGVLRLPAIADLQRFEQAERRLWRRRPKRSRRRSGRKSSQVVPGTAFRSKTALNGCGAFQISMVWKN